MSSTPNQTAWVWGLTGWHKHRGTLCCFHLGVQMGTEKINAGVTLLWTIIPSRMGATRNPSSFFMLQKWEISSSLLGYLPCMQTWPDIELNQIKWLNIFLVLEIGNPTRHEFCQLVTHLACTPELNNHMLC